MKRQISLQILRIFSMLMIVLCHLCNESKIGIFVNLAQLLNVGVFIFLFMSGYLYGRKKKIDVNQFYKKRAVKIMIPFYLFLLYIVLINLINECFNVKLFLSNLFNLQYIFGSLPGMEHLWFLTVLMLCYFITPFLHSIKNILISKKYIFYTMFFLICLVCALINIKFGNILFYLLVYIIGFMYNEEHKNKYIINLFFIVCAIIIRLQFKWMFDATILYDFAIVNLTHTVIAISLFELFFDIFKNVKESKIINYLDNISFFIYIVHYQFMHGPLRIIDNRNNFYLVISMILSVIVSVVFANLLFYISNVVSRRLEVK